jgi:beta-lactamase regulating signal transducer with metallopeptidase domain
MTSALQLLADLWPLALATLARATVLLAGALALSVAFGRTAAAARHALWTVTCVALLLLPWAPSVVPSLAVPWPSGVIGAAGGDAAARAVFRAPMTVAVGSDGGPLAQHVWDAPPFPRGQVPEPRGTDGAGQFLRGRALLLLLWLAGTAAATLSLALGVCRVRRMAGRATHVEDADWRSSLEDARRRVGVRRPVALGATVSAPVPLTGGVVRPYILVPEFARTWSAERREIVLLHELVHVARHDALRQLLGRLALALYWFHPLARLGARQALLAREEACDDAVVALGPRPSVYARHLLELSEPLRAPAAPLAALPLIERPQLERRVMAILSPAPRARARTTLAATACAAVWALTVAAATPAAQSVDAPQVPVPTAPPAAPAAPTIGILAPPTSPAGAPTAPVAVAPEIGEAPEVPAPPVPPAQERTCWSDGPGEDFVGTFFTREDADGNRFTERFGFAGGDRVIQTRNEDVMICMRVHGPVTFEDGGARIASLGEDAWVVLASLTPDRAVELVVTPGGAGPDQAWYVNGERRELDEDAIRWRDAMLPLLAAYWEASTAGVAGRASAEAARASLDTALVSLEARGMALDEVRAAQERSRSEMEAAVEAMRDAREAARVQLDTMRVRREMVEAEVARALAETRSQLEAVRAPTEEMREEMLRVREALTADRARREAEVAAAVRELREGLDPALMESRLREVESRLQEQIRRLREAIEGIP